MTMRRPSPRSAASASGVVGLDRIGDGDHAGGLPSIATKIAVAPSPRSASASRRERCVSTPIRHQRALPSATPCRRRLPVTPLPAASRSRDLAEIEPRARRATIARASGCSLPRSTLAASRSSSSFRQSPARRRSPTTFGLPSVSVPVLSITSVSTFSSRSSASAFADQDAGCAPRPTPTMIDIGVASPSAQGQAMISTADRRDQAKAKRGSGPNIAQAAKGASAAAITAGTNQPATRSARRWIGARERCASATISTIRASMRVAADLVGAHHEAAGLVDACRRSPCRPGSFSTGIDSPVTIDSSTKRCGLR
jgi:hypothetical protein